MITIQLNGEVREIPEGLTLTGLLEELKLPADRVAVERNLEIVPRDRWRETSIERGDRLEVVHFVGGGCLPSALSRVRCGSLERAEKVGIRPSEPAPDPRVAASPGRSR